MPIKDLLVLVDRTAAASQRLEFALAIAARFSARVTAMALVPHPYTPAIVGVHIPADLIQAQIEEAEREAEIVLEEAGQVAHRQGLELATTMASGPIGGLERRLRGRRTTRTSASSASPMEPRWRCKSNPRF
jgi:nucleotide-binding universal stress UspA family protein